MPGRALRILPPGVAVRFHSAAAEAPELSSHHQRIYVIPLLSRRYPDATAALPAVMRAAANPVRAGPRASVATDAHPHRGRSPVTMQDRMQLGKPPCGVLRYVVGN